MIEFSNSKQITWDFQVDSTQQSGNVQYDMIIGSDLLAQLGTDIAYSTKKIKWGEDSIRMKTLGSRADSPRIYPTSTPARPEGEVEPDTFCPTSGRVWP